MVFISGTSRRRECPYERLDSRDDVHCCKAKHECHATQKIISHRKVELWGKPQRHWLR
jgi:hypothetical protein